MENSSVDLEKQNSEEGRPNYEGKQYAEGRPSYPQQLFDFISSHTPSHDLVWDVATGNGQAAQSLAKLYKNVVATDINPTQIEHAFKIPNVTYHCTSPDISISELEQVIGPQSSVDLVSIATALHWFDLPNFYKQVKWFLRKPNGVIAAWGYTLLEVSPDVDLLIRHVFMNSIKADQHWEHARLLVEQKYETIDFPFGPVDGLDHTGPFKFNSEKLMDMEGLLAFLKSTSVYKRAKDEGVELLTEDVIDEFKKVWGENGKSQKIVTFPIYLRIGKAGDL